MHLLIPGYAGYPNTAAASLVPMNADVADMAHAQSKDALVGCSEDMEARIRELEVFLLDHVYRNPRLIRMDTKARRFIDVLFDAWREVRTRAREWLVKWEPRPLPGQPDPAEDRRVFSARCGARDRERVSADRLDQRW